MFVWVDTGVDTESLVRALGRPGHLLVPGALFSPQQQPSTYMRINVSLGDDAQFWQDFARCLRSAKQSSSPVPSEVAL
jgi:DNA-binding transcriptional MocR family regulator